MIEKYKTIEELIKYKEKLESQIKELKEKSDSGKWVLVSSDPNEKGFEDVIMSLEGSIKLTEMAIEAIKKI